MRAGQVEPVVPTTKSQSVRRPQKPAPARLDERGELPPDGAAYPQILRGESYVWWRSVLGVVFGLSLFLLMTTVVSQALVTVFWATTAGDRNYRDYFASAFAFELPIGMLSVNLGLINLFPVPMLDGGHLMFYGIEAIRGKPMNHRVLEYCFRFGVAVVLLLMVFATWNDIVNLKVIEFFKQLVS